MATPTETFSSHFERHLVLGRLSGSDQKLPKTSPHCSAEIVETWFERFSTDERLT